MGKSDKKATNKKTATAMITGTLGALLIAMLLLLVCSAAISAGVLKMENSRGLAVFICALSCFCGGLFVVRSCGKTALPLGVGTGFLFSLLLTMLGHLLFEDAEFGMGQLLILCICLCSGALAGLIGKKRKKRRI